MFSMHPTDPMTYLLPLKQILFCLNEPEFVLFLTVKNTRWIDFGIKEWISGKCPSGKGGYRESGISHLSWV